ncbi:hypothetical protein HDZ31DRAFT_2367, partial [Schizophyllum fasciatum]
MSENMQRAEMHKDEPGPITAQGPKQTSPERTDDPSQESSALKAADTPSADDSKAASKIPSTPSRFSTLATAVASFTGTLSKNLSLRRQQKPPIVFPPPSWSLDDLKNEGTGTIVTPSIASPASTSKDTPVTPTTPTTESTTELSAASASSVNPPPPQTDQPIPEPDPSEVQDAPEPQTLAQRIRAMIAVLPPPSSKPTSRTASPPPPGDPADSAPHTPKADAPDAPPIPLIVGADSKLM